MEQQEIPVPSSDRQAEQPDNLTLSHLPGDSGAERLPPVVCVASDDGVWAELLAQNLAARGASTIQCDLRSLKRQIGSIENGSWIVVDGGWPMVGLQSESVELNQLLRPAMVNTVMVVDELVGQHPLDEFEPDRVVRRTPDMRVLVRNLISIFNSVPTAPSEVIP